jgi:hypothetical protein
MPKQNSQTQQEVENEKLSAIERNNEHLKQRIQVLNVYAALTTAASLLAQSDYAGNSERIDILNKLARDALGHDAKLVSDDIAKWGKATKDFIDQSSAKLLDASLQDLQKMGTISDGDDRQVTEETRNRDSMTDACRSLSLQRLQKPHKSTESDEQQVKLKANKRESGGELVQEKHVKRPRVTNKHQNDYQQKQQHQSPAVSLDQQQLFNSFQQFLQQQPGSAALGGRSSFPSPSMPNTGSAAFGGRSSFPSPSMPNTGSAAFGGRSSFPSPSMPDTGSAAFGGSAFGRSSSFGTPYIPWGGQRGSSNGGFGGQGARTDYSPLNQQYSQQRALAGYSGEPEIRLGTVGFPEGQHQHQRQVRGASYGSSHNEHAQPYNPFALRRTNNSAAEAEDDEAEDDNAIVDGQFEHP